MGESRGEPKRDSMDAENRLPEISRTVDPSTGDYVWTLRVPAEYTRDVRAMETIKLRVAAWILRLAAQAIEEQP
jgi:hypothetical protein